MTDGEKLVILCIALALALVLVAVGWATFLTWRLRRQHRQTNDRINRLP